MKKLSIKFFSKIIVLLLGVLWISAGCDDCKDPKIPKNLPPIDWENYNDVYTACWNFDKRGWKLDGKPIKIIGWLFMAGEKVYIDIGQNSFWLTKKPGQAYGEDLIVVVRVMDDLIEPLQIKFANYDLTQKCYIMGKIQMSQLCLECCFRVTEIVITDINDIYIE